MRATMTDRVRAARVMVLALAVSVLGTACGGDSPTQPPGGGPTGKSAGNTPAPGPWSGPTGTIAYTRNDQLRLIEPDGSGDRAIWTEPAIPGSNLTYTVTFPAWRPDGGEIAFSSNHEQPVSIYERDIYAVRPDGSNLRKLTNGPTAGQLASFPKGTVTVTVQNTDVNGGPILVYAQGAPAPQAITLGPGGSTRLTFQNVADLGSMVQPVVAIFGTNRWFGGAGADVKAGQTVDAGVLTISSSGTFSGFGADRPFWRSDASKVGFEGPLCIVQQVPASPPSGFVYDPLVTPSAFHDACFAEWGPTAATANQLLLANKVSDLDGNTFVWRVAEGSSTQPSPVATFGNYLSVTDIHWLPDGSGFIVARQNAGDDPTVNFYVYSFTTGQWQQLTNFQPSNVFVRRFAISPDGRRLVFEVTDDLLFGASDLWIMNTDGSNLHQLVANAGYPAWNPTRP